MQIEKKKKSIISKIRYDYDLSQEQLADLLGVSQSHISKLELGKKHMGIEIKTRLYELFDVEI